MCFKVNVVCLQADYYYEYTECDRNGARWRVAIPGVQAPAPVSCMFTAFSCQAGQFLEMSAQECTPCAAGSYSLGSGVRFDQWDALPAGFSSVATSVDSAAHTSDRLSCNSSSWLPQGNYLESNRDECTVSLIYAVHLKKQGSVSFEYQYPDNNLLFEFFIQNDQCQEMDQAADTKWLKLTSHGEWASHTVNLKSGTNILYWRTGGMVMGTKVVKPVVRFPYSLVPPSGVAYTSECFPCKPGTFSRAPGSSACEACLGTLSLERKGLSVEGSPECKNKSPCSKKDYVQIHTACDHEGKVQHEPCDTAPSGDREPCPPCNPGYYNNDTATCSPCPRGPLSKIGYLTFPACKRCPAGTEPTPGYEFKWWNVLPPNMKSSCFNVGNSKCDTMNGWEAAREYVQSGAGSSDNDYLILNIHIPGFKLPTSMSGQSATVYGRITFEFETLCSADCELYFMMDVNRKSTTVVESWSKSQSKRSYSHVMTKNASVSYTWAFQRTNQPSETRRYVNDVARIFSVTVSNAVDGVSSRCRACAVSSRPSSSSSPCVPCPPGHYIHPDTSQCTQCPPNTYLSPTAPRGPTRARPAGPPDHSLCFSDCRFTHSEGNLTRTYDLGALRPVGVLMNGPSFTSKGTKYYHLYNISLCGGQMAECKDNVTDLSLYESQSGKQEGSTSVKAFICQSTIIPASGRGLHTSLSSQSITLADTFMGATVENTLDDITAQPELFPEASKKVTDVNFFYRSLEATSSCAAGRRVVVRLRCDPDKSVTGEISVPSRCPAGTCDGCTFHFLWQSSAACPVCSPQDYHRIEGACKGGQQDMLYVWMEPRVCVGGAALPQKKSVPCESLDSWIELGAILGALSAVLLVSLTCYFWKKNKRLEYKYSRLVMSANKECELPGADSCAVMEGETEVEPEDEVLYSKPSLIRKLKSLATKVLPSNYTVII
uniref:Si:ch211-233h19.2 n=2 Tax=Neogobius melanostomus TaxID=47308 RepID=A0A8C6SNP8_9GOBI